MGSWIFPEVLVQSPPLIQSAMGQVRGWVPGGEQTANALPVGVPCFGGRAGGSQCHHCGLCTFCVCSFPPHPPGCSWVLSPGAGSRMSEAGKPELSPPSLQPCGLCRPLGTRLARVPGRLWLGRQPSLPHSCSLRRFTAMLSSFASREKFINSVISLLRTHNFDGLDLFFLYPGLRGSPAHDRWTFLFLVEVRPGWKFRNAEMVLLCVVSGLMAGEEHKAGAGQERGKTVFFCCRHLQALAELLLTGAPWVLQSPSLRVALSVQPFGLSWAASA